MEGYINLFDNRPVEGNRPHFKVTFKIDGVDHEAALWPARDGKKGFSGKYKPKEAKPQEPRAPKVAEQPIVIDDELPF